MKFEFTTRIKGNHKLILIFSGWGTDPDFYRHIHKDGWDVLVIWDYSDFNFDKSLIDNYTTVYLYAWSLGVFAACRALKGVKLSASFAINGTRTPVNDINGIPENIYNGTIDNLSQQTLLKFRKRMFSDKEEYEREMSKLPKAQNITQLADQLVKVRMASADDMEMAMIPWTRVYISVDDRIFPYRNQISSWKGILQPTILHGRPHFIDLQEIVSNTIPDKGLVGRKFQEVLNTYDEYAFPQHQICNTLTRLIAEHAMSHGKKTLEIGAGTGLFTRMYGQLLIPSEAHFIDLYPIPIIGIAPIEAHATADAEEALETTPYSLQVDYILSTNTVQWFCDPLRFFHNAYNYLQPKGWLIFNTFIAGTLQHFDKLRPSPIVYRDKHELINELKGTYKEVITFEDEIQVYFDSPRAALLHLKHTGVNAGANSDASLSQLLASIPKDKDGRYYFTYHPLYILAQKD